MSLEKIIKYSVPFFVFAIVSRAIEEISFIYYAVPVMCVFFMVLLFIGSKFKVRDKLNKDIQISGIHLPSTIDHPPSSPPKADFALLNINSAKGGFRFAQHLPSPIIPLPFLLFVIPGLWFLLTALWSSYPEVSASRALYFTLISTGCMSAGILWIRFSGEKIFELLLPANVIVVVICLFSLITNIPSDSWTGGHGKAFMGFFGHQNLLASVLLFTLPTVFDAKIKDKSQKLKVFFFALLSLNLLVIALTYSRASILALIFGVIVFIVLNKKWKIITYGIGIAIIFFFIIYFIPSLNQFADKVIKKDFPEIYSSRMWMWEPSYKAALEGGLIGLGYGISHPEIRSGEYSDHFENGRLIREKGNSSLALMEETGLIGFVLFSLPILYLLFNIRFTISRVNKFKVQGLSINEKNLELRTSNPEQKYLEYHRQKLYLLSSTILALIIHSQFEAWWVGVGSVQLPLLFIYFGLIVQSSKFISLRSNSFTVQSSKFSS